MNPMIKSLQSLASSFLEIGMTDIGDMLHQSCMRLAREDEAMKHYIKLLGENFRKPEHG